MRTYLSTVSILIFFFYSILCKNNGLSQNAEIHSASQSESFEAPVSHFCLFLLGDKSFEGGVWGRSCVTGSLAEVSTHAKIAY